LRSARLTDFRARPAIRVQPLSLVQALPVAPGASVSYCSPHTLPFGSPAASLSTGRPVALRLPASRRGCPCRGGAPPSSAHATLINGGKQRICQGVVGKPFNRKTSAFMHRLSRNEVLRNSFAGKLRSRKTHRQPFVSLCVRGGAMEIER
jgi:hypothetical protein